MSSGVSSDVLHCGARAFSQSPPRLAEAKPAAKETEEGPATAGGFKASKAMKAAEVSSGSQSRSEATMNDLYMRALEPKPHEMCVVAGKSRLPPSPCERIAGSMPACPGRGGGQLRS